MQSENRKRSDEALASRFVYLFHTAFRPCSIKIRGCQKGTAKIGNLVMSSWTQDKFIFFAKPLARVQL